MVDTLLRLRERGRGRGCLPAARASRPGLRLRHPAPAVQRGRPGHPGGAACAARRPGRPDAGAVCGPSPHPPPDQRVRARCPTGGVRLLDPLGYLETVGLVDGAALVLTDSGGLQEETTVLGVPCLTARPSTERPVTITEEPTGWSRRQRDAIGAAVADR